MRFGKGAISRLAVIALTCFLGRASALAFEYQAAPHNGSIQRVAQAAPQASVFIACGEPARAASDRMKGIVGAINDVWGSRIRVYQSVMPLPPHARPRGCIFYNPIYLNLLMRHLMVQDSSIIEPLVYAIMAHEVGHEMHDDFGAARGDLSTETKELQADRFAGYTLQRLNIGLDNITPYYSLAGDEFSGARPQSSSSHGDSMRRTTALRKGWELGEWNEPEDQTRPLSEGE